MIIPPILQSTPKNECLLTGDPVHPILDFGQHPFADTFIDDSLQNISEPIFPLQVCLSPKSGSIQLKYISNSFDRYNLYSYSYTSSNSSFSRNHWDNYASFVARIIPQKGLFVEIGSNDGYLINQFKSPETTILGIDSSETMCDIANNNNIPTWHEIFSSSVAENIVDGLGKAQCVIANNVLNHANDPVDFVKGVHRIVADDGFFIFELPYWLSMVKSGKFLDQVYHEHISYFTIKSINTLLTQCGMYIESASIVNYHGGSVRVVAKKGVKPISSIIDDMIKTEENELLFTPELYLTLQQNFILNKFKWLKNFYDLKERNPNTAFIGVGAAAKANTWLNWHRFDNTMLKCITDSSEFKVGKYTPLSRIPIKSDEEFKNHGEVFALILSWNISEPLKTSLLQINPNIRFLHQ